jgi:hypothetical protein
MYGNNFTQWWGTVWNVFVENVDVECKCLIGSGSAELCLPYVALLILLGVRYNRDALAVHLIGGSDIMVAKEDATQD